MKLFTTILMVVIGYTASAQFPMAMMLNQNPKPTIYSTIISNVAIVGNYNSWPIMDRESPDFTNKNGTGGHSYKGPGTELPGEFAPGVSNTRGTISMANRGPGTNGSQFFINLKDNDFLNHTSESGSGWGYAVFGKVTEGLDVVDTIAAVKTGQNGMHGDVPLESVMINTVTIVE